MVTAKPFKMLIFVLVLIVCTLLINAILEKIYPPATFVINGVTFSPKYAKSLDLDWQKTYISILEELGVKNLRVPSYWDEIEKEASLYDFSEVDFMLDKANERGVKVILVLGARQPRWPECHIPNWAKKLNLAKRREKTFEFISKVLDRYKDHLVIWAWQVENEPFLKFFGDNCDEYSEDFLKKEVDLVKSVSSKAIIITDSGELGNWVAAIKLSDIFGTTVYRDVYDKFFGYTTYPLPPYFYSLKFNLVKTFLGQKNKKTIISELQTEPWSPKNDLVATPIDQQISLFPIKKFQKNIDYAKKAGFSEVYFWGVEWWYWMEKRGQPEYLEYAKTLFK